MRAAARTHPGRSVGSVLLGLGRGRARPARPAPPRARPAWSPAPPRTRRRTAVQQDVERPQQRRGVQLLGQPGEAGAGRGDQRAHDVVAVAGDPRGRRPRRRVPGQLGLGLQERHRAGGGELVGHRGTRDAAADDHHVTHVHGWTVIRSRPARQAPYRGGHAQLRRPRPGSPHHPFSSGGAHVYPPIPSTEQPVATNRAERRRKGKTTDPALLQHGLADQAARPAPRRAGAGSTRCAARAERAAAARMAR